jgi:hypothetical protein
VSSPSTAAQPLEIHPESIEIAGTSLVVCHRPDSDAELGFARASGDIWFEVAEYRKEIAAESRSQAATMSTSRRATIFTMQPRRSAGRCHHPASASGQRPEAGVAVAVAVASVASVAAASAVTGLWVHP